MDAEEGVWWGVCVWIIPINSFFGFWDEGKKNQGCFFFFLLPLSDS